MKKSNSHPDLEKTLEVMDAERAEKYASLYQERFRFWELKKEKPKKPQPPFRAK